MYYRHPRTARTGMYNDSDGRAIPIGSLVKRRLYRIDSRNLGPVAMCVGEVVAVSFTSWGFCGIREKFSAHFLATEYHYQGLAFASCVPWALLDEPVPEGLGADEFDGGTPLYEWLRAMEIKYAPDGWQSRRPDRTISEP